MPAISVVLPVYNRAEAVERAVRSVLEQDFADFELIVVDDGSTDSTPEVLRGIDDPRLRFVRQERNLGGNAARNRGIELATAPLLGFLDSDDFYLPHKLSTVVRYFADHPQVDVLLDSFLKLYPRRGGEPTELRNPLLDSNSQILEALFMRRIWKATPGVTVRRDVAIAAGKFDEGLKRRQDFDFILRLLAVGRGATLAEPLWVKTYAADAISADLRTFADSTVQFHRRHPEYYSNPVFRQGFALDVARHFRRLAKRRDWRRLLADWRTLSREVGSGRLLALTAAGLGRFKERRQRLRSERRSASGGSRAG